MFLTIGERINATRQDIKSAIKEKNADLIKKEIEKQLEAGAVMIDVNGGTSPKRELENSKWLMEIAAAACDAPLCIDSSNPYVIRNVAKTMLDVRGASVPEETEITPGVPWLMVNSVNAKGDNFDRMLPVIKEFNCAVVALCMGEGGAEQTAGDRTAIGAQLVSDLVTNGVKVENIYIDPLVIPVSVNQGSALESAQIMTSISQRFPGVRSVCGLSNISYGLPLRSLLNRAFLAMLTARGLHGAIMDPTDAGLMSALHAALAISNRDEMCSDYISAFRQKKLKV